ncbi:hypothetical protein L1049_016798 [Liquidambar formosana]|uniref:LEC14B homolog n=1 Tax=Liquidambar formosana TaxID=63359 RepID=A0AAP0S018_LIQFO
MARGGKQLNTCDGGNGSDGPSGSQGSNQMSNYLDHDIAQLTKIRSEPHELFIRTVPGKLRLPVSTVKLLAGREGWTRLNSRAYVSQFSADGSLFIAGCQGSQIRIYNVDSGWKVQKDILAKSLMWTITDTSLSPDQRYLVYASMSPVVHIVNIGSAATKSVANITEIHDGLDFSRDDDNDDFSIFSVKFSTDGRELVAGSSDCSIYVYDLEANKLTHRIQAHMSDVNTVCFGDETGHLIYSGSDDTLCKVWDRRCFTSKEQAAGVLMGHIEGITFLDSRGDGRYFISNGKDQTTKLWDIRKMTSKPACRPRCRDDEWDYRWMEYPDEAKNLKHPHDQSLTTYRGHSVLQTLIRCYFSPEYSTGQKYIYTGSSDSSVYIYDLVSGAQVARLNHHEAPVRDCSWHPFYPMIISSSFDGIIAKWEFPGDGEAPRPLKRRKGRRRILS